jgi:hypothetical protein
MNLRGKFYGCYCEINVRKPECWSGRIAKEKYRLMVWLERALKDEARSRATSPHKNARTRQEVKGVGKGNYN